MSGPILIVDDDPVQRRLLEATVMRMGYRTILADGGVSALAMLKARKNIVLVLLDLIMSDMDGFSVLRKMREIGLTTPVIVQTAQSGLDMAVKAVRLGAVDFVAKPVPSERLQVSISNVLKLDALTSEIRRVRYSAHGHLTFSDMMSCSSSMDGVIRLGQQAARSEEPVLIEGEAGAGKEMLARAIQGSGQRRGRSFINVNCASIKPREVDLVLFGHPLDGVNDTGDTGDTGTNIGKFNQAEGGTIFLDCVDRLPPHTQQRLLNVIQTGRADSGKQLNIRIIAASNNSVFNLVQTGRFDPALFSALGGLTMTLPPLRERREDIGLLVHHFLMRFACEEGRHHITGISPHALVQLRNYDWPGNVRQLENATFRAVVMCEKNELSADDFRQLTRPATSSLITVEKIPELRYALSDTGGFETQAMLPSFSGIDPQGEVRTLADAEEAMIRLAITRYDGQLSEVARRLGIGRTTLYRKLKDYDIDVSAQTRI